MQKALASKLTAASRANQCTTQPRDSKPNLLEIRLLPRRSPPAIMLIMGKFQTNGTHEAAKKLVMSSPFTVTRKKLKLCLLLEEMLKGEERTGTITPHAQILSN